MSAIKKDFYSPLSLFERERNKFLYHEQMRLLYLPTQIRFPIGGEHATCRGLKLTNSLGKQQLELWTRT